MPQASMSRCVVPRPVMASTTRQRPREFSVFRSFGDGFDVVADAGRGLGGLHEDGAGLELEGGLALPRGRRSARRVADDVDVAAEGFGQGRPALAELAGGQDEHAVPGRGEVGDGGLHRSGAESASRMMTSFFVPTKSSSCARTRV